MLCERLVRKKMLAQIDDEMEMRRAAVLRRLQFWLARGGETDAVSVPSFLLYDCVIYTTILLFYCSHILLYRFHITLVAQYCVCHVSILLVLLKYFFFYCSQREEQVRLTA